MNAALFCLAVHSLNEQMFKLYREELTVDQILCLADPARLLEAHGMLDDMEARMGHDATIARNLLALAEGGAL